MADPAAAPSGEGSEEKKEVPGVELEEEGVYREKELKELDALVHPDLKTDVGCSVAGLYELVGPLTLSCSRFIVCADGAPSQQSSPTKVPPLTQVITWDSSSAACSIPSLAHPQSPVCPKTTRTGTSSTIARCRSSLRKSSPLSMVEVKILQLTCSCTRRSLWHDDGVVVPV